MATYYFCDNTGPGAATGCPVGDNANAGTDPSLPKQNLVSFNISGAANTYRFARGSSTQLTATLSPGSGLSLTNRTVIEDYGHPGFASAQKPILIAAVNASGVGIDFITLQKKYFFHIRNLNVKGGGAGGQGFGFSCGLSQHVLVENCEVSQFAVGTSASESDLTFRVGFISFVNCEIHHNRVHGHFGGADHLLIEGCNIHHNGSLNSGRDHNIYIGVTAAPQYNITIRNNTLTFNEQYAKTGSKSVAMVFHGFFPNLLIEGNTIIDFECDYGHTGIAVNGVTGNLLGKEGFPNLIIRDNLIVGDKRAQVGITWNNAEDAIVENNTVVLLNGQENFAGIIWGNESPNLSRGDPTGARAKVRNNTVYAYWAFSSNENLIGGLRANILDDGGDEVVGNLVIFDQPDYPTRRLNAFNFHGRPASEFALVANNLAFGITGNFAWSREYTTLAQAQDAGFDTGSINANPLLVAPPSAANGYAVVLQAGSPAVGASHATKSARLAFGRKVPVGARDIGSGQRGATVVAPECPAVRKIV
ncbi:right-handed parallel beta-helix repeat-containing protein [Methylibium sp.]|uniref:right-handed parallel beta-helix repeat-containing protein n=1 Tax=Methylibium sp. TaxID=2067992 RepID=UPI00182B6F8A|nr:right-handed parallel beta-helix repeat-containing protein [Methylibium sp.]MBA3588204.1 right-handed parallel beta-helix repeat-containing protein [Methylibium sp.]